MNIRDDDSTGWSSTSRTDVNAALVVEMIFFWGVGERERRVATRALSAIMWNWKWLLVNGCECESQSSTAKELSIFCQDGPRASVCSGIMMKNNDYVIGMSATFSILMTSHLIVMT